MMLLGGSRLLWAGLDRVWYAPVFVWAIIAVMWGYITYARRLQVLAHHTYFKLLLPGYARWRGVMKVILLTLALVALFVALLQPQWGKKEVEVTQEGRDVLIALDVSRSMLAQDVKPSRLAFTKLKVRKLLQKLAFERVGLILFSGNAFVQCPLTADYKTFQMFLDHVTP
ncbi:MAG: VWA domain-containing protein, partial [Candidatus Dependentiae bacterium]